MGTWFHTKGYIFKHDMFSNIIIGSSNLTQKALTVNKEWNLLTRSYIDDSLFNDVIKEFNNDWNHALSLNDCLDDYIDFYNSNKESKKYLQKAMVESEDLKPNKMQTEFINQLYDLYTSGESRALLISATGTGKTFASAFALKKINPERILFLVHREQIAKQALEAYKLIFKNKSFGLISGNGKEYDKDFIFSTMQSMSRKDIYSSFKPDEFDFIIIDEVHRAGAPSYQIIMNYFNPKFYLGMTASPDRSDDFDIYELFDHNIAYEIRLHNALEENMLCPFHYFGISDIISLDDDEIHDKEDFNLLTSDERVKHIIQKAKYFGYSGNRVKGLIFCSRNDIAKELSNKFNKEGYNTINLSGNDNQEKRENSIDRLTSDTREDYLDYIFTVDIFNEGVDIPEINQIIMLRPTESTIIFLQQLGRGLRTAKNKDYVVVIDFIGNYDNNFHIPIALSGDRTYIKDNHRKWLNGGEIPGISSVSFDRLSKDKILKSINKASFGRLNFLKNKYINLKFKLGHVPLFTDFYKFGDIDPIVLIDYIKKSNSIKPFKTYYSFIKKVDKEYDEKIENIVALEYLQFLTLKIAYSKRPHELIILRELAKNDNLEFNDIKNILSDEFNIKDDDKSIMSAINFLTLEFHTNKEKEKYPNVGFLIKSEAYIKISDSFKEVLDDKIFIKYFNDILDYGLMQYNDNFSNRLNNYNLELYQKYYRADICQLLNWDNDDSSTVYGYRIKHNTCPIFVTYNKKDDISESTKYDDVFIDKNTFSWMTRSNVSLNSKEAVSIINYKENDLQLHLFIKKDDDEGLDFYYMGPVTPQDNPEEKTIFNNKGEELPIVNFKLNLNYPARDDIYKYLNS